MPLLQLPLVSFSDVLPAMAEGCGTTDVRFVNDTFQGNFQFSYVTPLLFSILRLNLASFLLSIAF